MSRPDEDKAAGGRARVLDAVRHRVRGLLAAAWFVLVGTALLATSPKTKPDDPNSGATISSSTGSSTAGGPVGPTLRANAPTITLTRAAPDRTFAVTVTAQQSESMSAGGAFYQTRVNTRHMLDGQATVGEGAVSVTAIVTDAVSGSLSEEDYVGNVSGDFAFDGDCAAPDPASPTPCQARLTVHFEQSTVDGGNWSSEVEWWFEFWPNPFDANPVEWEATFEEL